MASKSIWNGVGMMVMATATSGMAAAPQSPAQSPAQVRSAIQASLDTSASAWSAGDLDRFMTCYEDAATTTYVSGTNFVRGYAAIRAMYADRFGGGSRAKMGRLALEILDFRQVDPSHAYIVGRFHLYREAADGGDASGLTTLLFRKTATGWRIVADHS